MDQWITPPPQPIHQRTLAFGAHANSNNGNNFLSSSRALAVVACLLAATAQGAGTHAVAATCPSQQEGSPLNGATVFDGPPDQKTDLMPDTTRHRGSQVESSWDVRYVFEQKREVFLACKYVGHAEPLIVRISEPVAACTYRTADPGKPVEMRCR